MCWSVKQKERDIPEHVQVKCELSACRRYTRSVSDDGELQSQFFSFVKKIFVYIVKKYGPMRAAETVLYLTSSTSKLIIHCYLKIIILPFYLASIG